MFTTMTMITLVLAQQAGPEPPPKFIKVANTSDAIGWAISHNVSLPEDRRPFARYIWISPHLPQLGEGDKDQWDERHVGSAINWVVNAVVSKAGYIVPCERIANGWMLVYYTDVLFPVETERLAFSKLFDSIAIDEPYFHHTKENSGERVAVAANHIDYRHAELLATTSLNPALVYRSDHFLKVALEDKYYDFKGWVHEDGKLFTQGEVYATLGIDEEKSKVKNGDQRVAISVSGVTNSTRRVDRLQGVGGRFNTAAVWQTWDISRKTKKISNNVFYNLLKFSPDGGEAIMELPNGLHGWILYNKQRQLVREADPNIATDWRAPPGHSQVLFAGLSCVRCHGPHEGLWPAPNHIRQLINSGENVIDEFVTDIVTREVIDRLAGLYMGNFDKRLTLGRLDYDESTRIATMHQDYPQGIGIIETSALVSAIYESYVSPLNAEKACWELGYDPKQFPRETLTTIAPPTNPRNPVMGLLRTGINVTRNDWEQVFAAARYRVVQYENPN